MPPNRPLFIALPPLDIADYARYLLERGWRLELDDAMEFGYRCISPADQPHPAGWAFRDAVIYQSELDLRRHFDHLFAVHHLPDLPPPLKETPDAEPSPNHPG